MALATAAGFAASLFAMAVALAQSGPLTGACLPDAVNRICSAQDANGGCLVTTCQVCADNKVLVQAERGAFYRDSWSWAPGPCPN